MLNIRIKKLFLKPSYLLPIRLDLCFDFLNLFSIRGCILLKILKLIAESFFIFIVEKAAFCYRSLNFFPGLFKLIDSFFVLKVNGVGDELIDCRFAFGNLVLYGFPLFGIRLPICFGLLFIYSFLTVFSLGFPLGNFLSSVSFRGFRKAVTNSPFGITVTNGMGVDYCFCDENEIIVPLKICLIVAVIKVDGEDEDTRACVCSFVESFPVIIRGLRVTFIIA